MLRLFYPTELERAMEYPKMRYMGSKHKLLPWIAEVLEAYPFETVLDGFSGSGAVSYLFKSMGKKVSTNDFLHFSHILSLAVVENSSHKLSKKDIEILFQPDAQVATFIQDTFKGVFYTREDLAFLDRISWNIKKLENKYKKALALSALIRACIKKQPRGVFTVSGDLEKYNDGRRDLRISIEQHFIEQIQVFNDLVFSNGHDHHSLNSDVFSIEHDPKAFDLVYLDPPYVPKSDDNCYVKRYHFLEGLSKYWEGEEILMDSKVKKIKKKFTPFSYRSHADEAFQQLFTQFHQSIIVLSYSSNGYPDLNRLVDLMGEVKEEIEVFTKPHRYHFGNHASARRSLVEEYLIIGR